MRARRNFSRRAAEVVVTLEDHVLPGGYGASVLELFNEKRIATPVVRIGWPDQFIEHATTVDHLREKYGLTAANVVAQGQGLGSWPKRRAGAADRRGLNLWIQPTARSGSNVAFDH